jgi:hypothetical protein
MIIFGLQAAGLKYALKLRKISLTEYNSAKNAKCAAEVDRNEVE